MIILVFDVETSGLPPRASKYKRYPDPMTETLAYNSARIVELAYTMYSYENNNTKHLIRSVSSLVNPNDEFTIENTSIHGIEHKVACAYGSPVKDILTTFIQDVARSDKLVAHNLEFDYNIVLAECYRAGIDPSALLETTRRCTMKYAIKVMSLSRYPKLVDLYNDLCRKTLGCSWKQTHRALDDTEKCADVYFALHTLHRERTISISA